MTQFRCCKCDSPYDFRLFSGKGIDLPLIKCPACGLVHTVDFQTGKYEPTEPLSEIRLTGYYIDTICDSDLASDDSGPGTSWITEDRTGHNPADMLWIGVRCQQGGSKEPAPSNITLRVRKDGGLWYDLGGDSGPNSLDFPGTGNMVYTDLTPPNAVWFCTTTCGETLETDGMAQDNGATITAADSQEDYEIELWWAIDPSAGTPGSLYEFAWTDNQGKFSDTLLAASVTLAAPPVDLVISDAGMNYHALVANEPGQADGTPLDLTEVVDLVISDAGMNYHAVRVNDGADLVITEVVPPTDLVITDAGMNYHTVRVDNGVDLTLVHDHYIVFTDAGMNFHLLRVDNGVDLTLTEVIDLVITDAGMNYHLVRVDNGVDLTLTEVIDLVITDAGMNYHTIYTQDPLWWPADAYHDLVDVPPYAFSVLGAYHDHVVDPTDLTLVESGAIDLVISDAGMNYHTLFTSDPLWWPDDCYHIHAGGEPYAFSVLNAFHDHVAESPYAFSVLGAYHDHIAGEPYAFSVLNAFHLHTAEAAEVFSVRGAYHDHAVDPTNLTLVETGDVDLVMTDGGAYHNLVSDNVRIDPAWVYPLDCANEHIVTPTHLVLMEVHELTITPDPYHETVTKDEVWFVQEAFSEIVTTPSDLTLDITHILTVDACFHAIEDGAPLTLVQVFTLVLSDAGVNFHVHLVIPSNLTISELGPVDLIMIGGGAFHLHQAPNLKITEISSVVIDVADAIRTLVDLTTNRTLHLL